MKTNQGRGAAEDAIIIELPAELKDMADSLRSLIATVEAKAQSLAGRSAVDYAKLESDTEEHVGAIERAVNTEYLRRLDVDSARVLIHGKEHVRVGRFPGSYYTRTGKVSVLRSIYRECGSRNAKTVDAISLRAGVSGQGWLPRTAQCMSFYMQEGTSRGAQALAAQSGILPYDSSTFDRVAHTIGEDWMHEHADIEDCLIQELIIPPETASISMSLDRVSIPMEEPCQRKPGRPRKDAPKNPIKREYRMGYCGTVTLHDKKGQAVHTIRYGCMPKGDARLLSAGMSDDVTRLLEQDSGLRVTLLADGAHEMWNLLEPYLDPAIVMPHRLIDFYHLIEKLSPAAKVMHGEEKGKQALARWRKHLLKSSSAAAEILDELRRSGVEHVMRGTCTPVHDAITYLHNHADRMNYAFARRKGLPIGSGNVEATCKTLVDIRMKRAGSRWKERSGEHIIRLRALALSDRWEPAMQKLQVTRRTSVSIAA
ncbi:MAG: ISKra4 family transposase [bacterium]|nr:ISKra4 family transposase [bacterium]